MVDIHCHIIYGVDDGSPSLSASAQMAKMAADCGVTDIIATPHCNVPDSYGNHWNDDLDMRFNEVKETVKDYGIPVNIHRGQEVFCNSRTIGLIRSGYLITLNDTEYLLTEFAFNEQAVSAFEKTEMLVAEGFKPVIAHPERYGFIREDTEAAIILKNIGCRLQVNKGSITGRFGREIKDTAEILLENQLADAVASDAHSAFMRTPELREAYDIVKNKYSADYAELLFTENPSLILSGKDL